jgi:hypothetical protein
MLMEYLLHKDPGPHAVRIAEDALRGLGNVDKVIFVANQIDSMGKCVLRSKAIVIDLERIVKNRDLVIIRGMFLHLGIWCNLVYTIYHEAAHARIAQDEGWDKLPADEWEVDTEVLEAETHARAINSTITWFIDHECPPIGQMGWLGKRIADHMNYFFASGNVLMEEEIRLMGTPAAGRADLFIQLNGKFGEMAERLLYDRIDEGVFGYLNNGTRYLRMNEILAGNEE